FSLGGILYFLNWFCRFCRFGFGTNAYFLGAPMEPIGLHCWPRAVGLTVYRFGGRPPFAVTIVGNSRSHPASFRTSAALLTSSGVFSPVHPLRYTSRPKKVSPILPSLIFSANS